MNEDTFKLFRVTLRGFNSFGEESYKTTYVVSKSLDEAYNRVKTYFEEKNYGYKKDRELEKIELIAEENSTSNIPLLFTGSAVLNVKYEKMEFVPYND